MVVLVEEVCVQPRRHELFHQRVADASTVARCYCPDVKVIKLNFLLKPNDGRCPFLRLFLIFLFFVPLMLPFIIFFGLARTGGVHRKNSGIVTRRGTIF